MRILIKLLIINIFYKAKDFVLFAYKISPTKPTIFSYIPSVIVLNKLQKILPIFILFINLFLCCEAFGALNITGNPVLDFGIIMQNEQSSIISLDTAGNITSYSGIFKPGGTSSTDTITYKESAFLASTYSHVVLQPENATSSINIPGCNAYISNVVSSDDNNDFNVRGLISIVSCRNLSNTFSLNYGATLVLDGLCDVGEYSGTITIPATTESCSPGTGTSQCAGSCGNTTSSISNSVQFKVKIDAPLEVEETQSMHFGSILANNGGTVTVDPASGKLSPNGVTIFNLQGGKQGIFKVTGIGGRQVNITIPNNSTTLTRVGGTEKMKVSNLKLNTSTIQIPNVTLTEASEYFSVGGTLTVGANQKSGTYSGTYTVNVSY